MRTIQLQGVSFPVSAICLGTAYFGSRDSEALSREELNYYYDCGGRFLNTAHEYGYGASEQVIGRWLRDRGNRSEMVITTKGGEDDTKPSATAMRREELLEDADVSLGRLAIDCIDFFLLHIDDPDVPVAEILDTLRGLQKAGKIRHYGCSNWSVERMEEADAYADAHGIERFVMHEIEWNLSRRNTVNRGWFVKWLDEDYIAWHERTKMPVAAYSPMAMGVFSKYAAAGNFDTCSLYQRKFYESDFNRRMAEKLMVLARETGYSIVELQIGYLCSQPRGFADFPIVGSSKLAQLQESLRGTDCHFTQDMLDYLQEE
ncbi:MAG TPA: hypothetical protein DD640_07340 [Clostridiales bacterium]|nr:hypothetical protein [Clostridiales bacterium]